MKKKLLPFFIFFICAVPSRAVFNEKNISSTISVLRHELHVEWKEIDEQEKRHEKSSQMEELRHRDMVGTIKRINELTLILYSQEKDFTLDQTYAMESVMHEYKQFNKRRRPQYMNNGIIDAEIERYQRLIETLRLLPPKLDAIEEVPENLRHDEDTTNSESYLLSSQTLSDRDSCIKYAKSIIGSYTRTKERMAEDEMYYNEMSERLRQNYEYSKSRYNDIQKYIFVTGQEDYFYVLSNLGKYFADACDDMEQKYGSGNFVQDREELRDSQWRGSGLADTVLYSLLYLLVITAVSILAVYFFLGKVKALDNDPFRKVRPILTALSIAVIFSILISAGMLFPMSNSTAVMARLALVYLWLVIALMLSILIGLRGEESRQAFRAFQPIIILGLLTMFCRASFLPDKMLHLTLTPILLIFFVWQIHCSRTFKKRCRGHKTLDVLMTISSIIFGLALLSAVEGYSLFALMLVMWWTFQLTLLATLATIRFTVRYIDEKYLKKKKDSYALSHTMASTNQKGDFIRVTWLIDFIYTALLPIAFIYSILASLYLASGIFNLTETCQSIFHKAFIELKSAEGSDILQITLYKLASVGACFYLFRYFYYLICSLYRSVKLEKVMLESGNDFVRQNDVNLTLAYNVIGIVIWGVFAFYTIYLLKIPIGALSIVAAGLATGIGLALKDVLNNFIYGIQLMSGRLRVGDIVECDGFRGTVEKISYQSTEIETVKGSVISFTNSTLFNKNFQNLTKNTPYEFVSVEVSISYGEDVNRVRELILTAMKEFSKRKDKYGRYLVERKSGIKVTVAELAESSVNLAIKQMVLVESKTAYVAEVKEAVYKLFNDNGIVMPFPQQEISILNFPEKQ